MSGFQGLEDRLVLAFVIVAATVAVLLALWQWRRGVSAIRQRLHTEVERRQRAEQALRTQQLRTDALLGSTQDGIIAFDAQGQIEWFNAGAEAILRCPAETALHHPVGNVWPLLGAYLPGARDPRAVLPQRATLQGERLDGEAFPLELTVVEVWVEGHALYLAVVRDLSDQERVERMKRDFVTVVSHELRTPLTSIRGALGLLTSGSAGELPAPAARMARIAKDNSDRLVHLVNDILDAERLASGQMAVQAEILDAALLVTDHVRAMEGYARLHQASLVTHLPEPRTVWIDVDRERMHQVLANLVSNAIKHSPTDGVVEIEVSVAGAQVRISVTDQGPGLPLDFHARVFVPFAQADNSDVRQRSGSGLGLSIAKGLTERMGGSIGFESPVGGPTRFWVELPLSPAPTTLSSLGDTGLEELIV